MPWGSIIKLLIALVSLGKEIFHYINEKEQDEIKKAKKVQHLKAGFRKARTEKDTSEIESALTELGFDLRINGMSDKKGKSLDA